jgi:negative regulator of flagellin synthesis FlgM
MDIRSGFEGLKSILGDSQATTAVTDPKVTALPSGGTGWSGMASDHATFSNAGSMVAQSSSDAGVRLDKVAQIQAALAAGTYNSSPSAMASKMVDSMLGSD